MRLWHEKLIVFLPRQQLLGQHRECCALRGNGWGKKHSTVDYVFTNSPYKLYRYHMLVMDEMTNRGYNHDLLWEDVLYRGKKCNKYSSCDICDISEPIYSEHDDNYLLECIDNLKAKGISIEL